MEITRKHASDFTRLFDILSYQKEKYPNQNALNVFESGMWKDISIEETQQKVDALSCWLMSNGYLPGEKIILIPVIGKPTWVIIDLACQQCGLITVPVHPTSSPDAIKLIIEETDARLCIVDDVDLFEKIKIIKADIESDVALHHLNAKQPEYFQALQFSNPGIDQIQKLFALKSTISEHDIVTIMYTSGSSGIPKGVLLSHNNIVFNIKAILTLLPLEPKHRALSFLPFSHIFERMACYGYMAFGVSIYFSQNKESFEHDFKTVKPFFCTTVPRVLEKMYDYMQEQLLGKNIFKKKLIKWALAVGKQYRLDGKMSLLYSIELSLARILVLSQWRKKLGGQIRYMVVGAASLQPEIGRLFSAAGIHVVEGYGMTETAPLISINRYEPGQNRFDSVGIPIPGIEVKIDLPNDEGEGEILIKGPNVMHGYFNRAELNTEVFTDDGWFRTGDIGKFVHNRFLKITDRKKDIFKTSAGKYIAPQPLQKRFAKSHFIQRTLIIGFQRPFVTALILPNSEILEAWCTQQHIHWTSLQFMVHNIKVRSKFQNEVDLLNEDLQPFERIRNFVLCDHEWTIERGELTNTLKPVAQKLMGNYEREIDKMYP